MGGWGKIGGGAGNTLLCEDGRRKDDQATISLDMKYHFMKGRFCHASALLWNSRFNQVNLPDQKITIADPGIHLNAKLSLLDIISSVADPVCLSRILIFPIPDPGSRIPDPKTATKKRGQKKLVVIPFFCSHKFHKIENYLSFKMLKNKIWANFQRIIELFTQKIVTMLLKIWVWDPRSGIRKKTCSGSRIQGSKRHRIPDPDPQHR